VEKLIFIVDDEQAISKLLSYWAKDKWKYNVETFANAEDALKNPMLFF
jgi:DNA-binding NtrC family response regulator